MASARLVLRPGIFTARTCCRALSTTTARQQPDFTALNKRGNDTAQEYRKFQTQKPLQPHMTNTTSTIANEMPDLGADSPPPELITNVDPDFVPMDSKPENTKKMTGGTQAPKPKKGANTELKTKAGKEAR